MKDTNLKILARLEKMENRPDASLNKEIDSKDKQKEQLAKIRAEKKKLTDEALELKEEISQIRQNIYTSLYDSNLLNGTYKYSPPYQSSFSYKTIDDFYSYPYNTNNYLNYSPYLYGNQNAIGQGSFALNQNNFSPSFLQDNSSPFQFNPVNNMQLPSFNFF